MMNKIPRSELVARMQAFRDKMCAAHPDWRQAAIFSKVNLYYLTGTMPDGVLIISREAPACLWVRKSYERSRAESVFPEIRPMKSFRELAGEWQPDSRTIYVEKEVLTLAHLARFSKYFSFEQVEGLDRVLGTLRAVKRPWELAVMKQSGDLHRRVMEEDIPGLLKRGISEAAFGAEVFACLLKGGHHGLARVGMFNTELFGGIFCFGESAVMPNPFDGPGGLRGLSPAAPVFGSPDRKLKRGDLVFVDIACGIDGYHTDKTMVYSFGAAPSAELLAAHQTCVDIQNRAAEAMKPGVLASEVYRRATAGLSDTFLEGFMGVGDQQVKFLGHGVGLHIDELPIIAPNFDQALQENMTLALEPKKGFPGLGMVGIENTFQVTPGGGVSLTGESFDLRQV